MPQSPGPGNNGGTKGAWGCFLRELAMWKDKEALNHQRARGLRVKQKCKGKNEHGRVAGVLEAWSEAWLSEKAPDREH